MYFAQFYDRKLDGTLQEAVGDRAVLILDGRSRKAGYGQIAMEWAVKHGFQGYSIHVGTSFTDARRLSGPWGVPGKPDDTASAAAYGA